MDDDDDEATISADDDGDVLATTKHRRSVRLVFYLCSQAGLVTLVVIYTLAGAALFEYLEGSGTPSPHQSRVQRSRDETLRELWTITERLNVLYESNWTRLVHEQLQKFESNVVAETATAGARHDDDEAILDRHAARAAATTTTWTFGHALLYTFTLLTTIGHGAGWLVPRTATTKLLTMGYALVGVPLMLACLASVGHGLARTLVRRPRYHPAPTTDMSYPPSSTIQQHGTPSRAPLIVCEQESTVSLPPANTAFLVLLLLVLVGYVCIGGAMLSMWVGCGFLDAVYVCFLALATIGLGELGQLAPHAAACSLYLVLGLVLLASCFILLQERVAMLCRPLRHKHLHN